MPPFTADLDRETPTVQDILGGTCPLAPMQICLLWAARQEKIISPLAFSVYVAAHEVKFWRCKTEPGQTYRTRSGGQEDWAAAEPDLFDVG